MAIRTRRLLLGSALLTFWLMPDALIQAQDRVLSLREKGGQDVNLVMGKIVEESAAKLVVQTSSGAKQAIPAELVVEVTYQLPAAKAKAREAYQKAEGLVQSAGQAGSDAKRKELLSQAITLFNSMLPDVKESKPILRHVQFKIASLSAQRARGDQALSRQAVESLERFLQEHADSWQSHFATKLLAELKK